MERGRRLASPASRIIRKGWFLSDVVPVDHAGIDRGPRAVSRSFEGDDHVATRDRARLQYTDRAARRTGANHVTRAAFRSTTAFAVETLHERAGARRGIGHISRSRVCQTTE